jgi:chloramphenicol-sensitive protein RarD
MSGAPSSAQTAARHAHEQARLGLIFGIGAYGIWGFFPLYFPLLTPATPLEILSERFVFSLLFMATVLSVSRTWSRLRPVLARPRTLVLVFLASVLITINWGVYIYGVNSGQVVEASLGYFINPLVTVLLGVLILRERLRPLQWTAVGIATVAVLVLSVANGRMPWIALVLAFTFGGYGLVKKIASVDPQASLTLETAFMSPLALSYLVYLQVTGTLVLFHSSTQTTLLLMGLGVITAIPLLLFGGAANRVPLTTMGVLQYLTPIIQFCIGVWVDDETMPPSRWAGFAIVWVALMVFSYDGLRQGRRYQAKRRADGDAGPVVVSVNRGDARHG